MAIKKQWFAAIVYVVVPLATWYYGYTLYLDSIASLYRAGPELPAPPRRYTAPADGGEASDPNQLDDGLDSVITFIHATDIHISKYSYTGQYIHFLHFLSTAVPLISPRFVAATGDLTDGKDELRLASLQQFEEWSAYQAALRRSEIIDRNNGTFWFDQRGNHDCFNVPGWTSASNYYRDYGAIKRRGYHFDIEELFGKYSFIATDGCPDMGVGRPLNFFGYLDATAMDRLESQLARARHNNHTIMLNHYPTSIMVYGKTSGGKSFSELTKDVSLFLCGHLHLLKGGIGAQLQTYHPERFLELELGDMKDHGLYRVYAIDHDLISFADVQLPLSPIPYPNPQSWLKSPLSIQKVDPVPHPPVVLVTNPKDSRYIIPNHEPLERINRSTFIRILVWADTAVDSVHAFIDGVPLTEPATYRGLNMTVAERWKTTANNRHYTPLWVIPWDPAQYEDGREHTLVVVATDRDGKVGEQQVLFRLDGRRIPLNNTWRGGWIMNTDFQRFFKQLALFEYFASFFTIFWMPHLVLWLHYWRGLTASSLPQALGLAPYDPVQHQYQQEQQQEEDEDEEEVEDASSDSGHNTVNVTTTGVASRLWTTVRHICGATTLRLVTFSQTPHLYWPLYLYMLSLPVAPVFVGNFVPALGSKGIGSLYAYGIYLEGTWIPLLDSWFTTLMRLPYGITVVPLYLGCLLTPTWCIHRVGSKRFESPLHRHWIVRSFVVLGFLYYMVIPFLMYLYAYDSGAMIYCLLSSWYVPWTAYQLWYYDWRHGTGFSRYYKLLYTPSSAQVH